VEGEVGVSVVEEVVSGGDAVEGLEVVDEDVGVSVVLEIVEVSISPTVISEVALFP